MTGAPDSGKPTTEEADEIDAKVEQRRCVSSRGTNKELTFIKTILNNLKNDGCKKSSMFGCRMNSSEILFPSAK